MSRSVEPQTIWIWPWSHRSEPEGEVAVQIDDSGGLFLDPEDVAKSETFQKQLQAVSALVARETP